MASEVEKNLMVGMLNHMVDVKTNQNMIINNQKEIIKQNQNIIDTLNEFADDEIEQEGNNLGGFQDRLFTLINQNPTAAAEFAKGLGLDNVVKGFFKGNTTTQ